MRKTTEERFTTLFRKPSHGGTSWVFGLLCLAVFAVCAGCASVPDGKGGTPVSRIDEPGIAEKLGIKPVAIRLTAGGRMIDFRYTVVDPAKSAPVFDRKTKTYLIDLASGGEFPMPEDTKLGPLRSSGRNPQAGREYFIFFSNPANILQRGSRVAVVIGDYRIENLTVE